MWRFLHGAATLLFGVSACLQFNDCGDVALWVSLYGAGFTLGSWRQALWEWPRVRRAYEMRDRFRASSRSAALVYALGSATVLGWVLADQGAECDHPGATSAEVKLYESLGAALCACYGAALATRHAWPSTDRDAIAVLPDGL